MKRSAKVEVDPIIKVEVAAKARVETEAKAEAAENVC